MKRNHFGDPQPCNGAEIIEALDELDMSGGYVTATIYHDPEEEGPFAGFTARIADADAGEPEINTLGFESKEALKAALHEAGITDIEELF